MNAPKKPYFIRKDFQTGRIVVRAGVIYTRLSDTNIPRNETAPEDHIEIMWKERLGLLALRNISLEEDVPVKLGDSKERVLEILGEPDAIGWQIAHYYSDGIEVSYDQHFDTVDGLNIYSLPNGAAFEGTVFGIKLRDSFAKVKEIIGRPSHWGLAYENSSIAIWEIDDKLLVIGLWRNSSKKTLLPSQQLGTVESITYCNRKSFVGYTALVAIAIEQLKRGITPELFERENILTKNIGFDGAVFDEAVFEEEYEILGAQPAVMGGAEVFAAFTESQTVLAFWIYPLAWKEPVIRAIYKIKTKPTTT